MYYPEEHEKKNMVFMNTVSQNKQAFTKRVARQSIGVPQKIGTTRNGGRTNHVLTVATKDTYHATVQRSGTNANPRKL